MKQRLAELSTEPGVYKMMDNAGDVIYVGKAKNLKKRVSSYFLNRHDRDVKTIVLVSKIVDIQTIVTRTEEEALILERQLIYTLQPRYNIALKDDKNYPYIKISLTEPFPRLFIVREKLKDRAKYFGPFPSIGSTRYLQRMLLELFPLRDCKQVITLTEKQPKCIKLDLGKCLGPCVIKSIKPEYDQIVEDLSSFLKGTRQKLLHDLERQMWEASEHHRFEHAVKLRDTLQKLRQLLQRQVVQLSDMSDTQVWVMMENEAFRYALVQNFVEGKLLYQNGFYEPITTSGTTDDFLNRAVIHFVDQNNPAWSIPKQILCDTAFLPILKLTQNGAVLEPKKGESLTVLDSAKRNATLALSRLVSHTETVDRSAGLLKDIQSTLSLPHLPTRIIGIDISHWQGQDIVGSAVYFKDGKPFKAGYRKFAIRSVKGQSNDPQSIYEVVLRRLRLLKEEGDLYPDLLLIDGGRGQLNFALKALEKEGVLDIPIVSLAKREEEVYFPNRIKPLKLGHHHPVLQLLQRVRDESHRFALTYQRSTRTNQLRSQLEAIPGLGTKRIAQLYKTYRSLKKMANTTPQDLSKTLRISLGLAEKISKLIQQGSQHADEPSN